MVVSHTHGEPAPGQPMARTLVAACAGSVVEWYDVAVQGALAVLVTPLFITTDDSGTVLTVAFAVYATACVASLVVMSPL